MECDQISLPGESAQSLKHMQFTVDNNAEPDSLDASLRSGIPVALALTSGQCKTTRRGKGPAEG